MKASSSLRALVLVIVCSFALIFSSCGGGTSSSAPPAPPPPPPGGGSSQLTTIAIIMLENTSYEHVVGSPSMPFLNSLIPQGALATQYFANTHPSIGNYFMLTTGQIISNDDAFSGPVADDNIVRRLVAAGKTWKSYCQSLPSAAYLEGDEYPYIKHHDPFTYFTDITESPAQAQNIVPLPQLEADEAASTFPNFMFIAPDNVHNAHDCPGGFNSTCTLDDKLAAADAFLSANVPPLLNNQAFKEHGVLIVMFDEGDLNDPSHGGGHALLLALGSHVKSGFQSSTVYQHQNTLRTIGDSLGFTAPGSAATASPMSDLFQ